MNLQDIWGKVQEMRQKMQQTQDNLVNIRVEGESGGGMVKAVANGTKQIVKLEIDKALLSEEPEIMADLIVAAVNQALQKAEEKSKEEMHKITSEILPNFPNLSIF